MDRVTGQVAVIDWTRRVETSFLSQIPDERSVSYHPFESD
jgi:hypothetical protein